MPEYDVTITTGNSGSRILSKTVSVQNDDASAEHRDICPVCGSANLIYTGDAVPAPGGAKRSWRCPDCNSTGHACYGITFSRHTVDE